MRSIRGAESLRPWRAMGGKDLSAHACRLKADMDSWPLIGLRERAIGGQGAMFVVGLGAGGGNEEPGSSAGLGGAAVFVRADSSFALIFATISSDRSCLCRSQFWSSTFAQLARGCWSVWSSLVLSEPSVVVGAVLVGRADSLLRSRSVSEIRYGDMERRRSGGINGSSVSGCVCVRKGGGGRQEKVYLGRYNSSMSIAMSGIRTLFERICS